MVLVVRAYRLAQPRTFEFLKEYGGCKSWTTMAAPLALAGMTACCDDAAYAAKADAVTRPAP